MQFVQHSLKISEMRIIDTKSEIFRKKKRKYERKSRVSEETQYDVWQRLNISPYNIKIHVQYSFQIFFYFDAGLRIASQFFHILYLRSVEKMVFSYTQLVSFADSGESANICGAAAEFTNTPFNWNLLYVARSFFRPSRLKRAILF